MSKEKVKSSYTWEEIFALVNTCDVFAMDDAIRQAPAEWQRALALAFSVAKWSPLRASDQRGQGCCGLCSYRGLTGDNCSRCLLGKLWKVHYCGQSASPWSKWARSGIVKSSKWADRIYNDLVKLYTEEYHKA